jgi:tetratricopeptide (TPR) repeat protein
MAPITCRTIRLLGRIIHLRTGGSSDADKLLRTALQINTAGVAGEKEEICITLAHLSRNLADQKLFTKSEHQAREAIQLSERQLGTLHPTSLFAKKSLARCLRASGNLLEIERLYGVFEVQETDVYGALSPANTKIFETYYEHAVVLEQMEQIEKAFWYYDKAMQGILHMLGAAHSHTMRCCEKLGQLYEKQRRYDDAVSLYTRYIGKLRDDEAVENAQIAKCKS